MKKFILGMILLSNIAMANDLIKQEEGLVLHAYKCQAGVWTIGYGHTGYDVKKGMRIGKVEADRLLAKDLIRFEKVVNNLNADITEKQKEALVSLAYNIGTGAFSRSKIARLVKEGKLKEASNHFQDWIYVNGKVSKGLVNRRKREQKLFMEDL